MNKYRGMMVEKVVRQLMNYNGRSEFTSEETVEITELLSMLQDLDPEGEYASVVKIDLGVDHSDNIIPFRKKGKRGI